MFVVCGESLMDVFASGDTPTGCTLDARVGGSPFNVAIGLARLGQPVAFLSSVSRDFLGERLMRALRDEGVDTSIVARVAAPTTLGLVGLDAQGVAAYAFYGAGGADRLLGMDALEVLPPATRALHFGSYAMVVEPVASTLRALAERESGRRLVAWDPNVRLNVEPDLARWRDTLRAMLPHTHLLKISEEDLHLLLPGASMDDFAAEAMGAGVQLVVVTRGAAGAWARSVQARVATHGDSADVIDTVGAGDTFQAALLAWLAEHGRLDPRHLGRLSGDELALACGFASRAAAITCARRGADLPRRNELTPGVRA